MTPLAETHTQNALPSEESFLADFGIGPSRPKAESPTGNGVVDQGPHPVVNQEVSKEFRGLIVEYCAMSLYAYALEEVRWDQLARRLGTDSRYLEEAAKSIGADGSLWQDVLGERIKRARASKVFRDSSWEQLEAAALNKLMSLMERNLIRDPGELLAVASTARKTNVAPNQPVGNTVNINIGGDPMGDGDLPAAGAKMTIDLSPRVASALQKRQVAREEQGQRVIDGEMLSAKELRAIVEQPKESVDEDSAT